jgi:hypothetical protein
MPATLTAMRTNGQATHPGRRPAKKSLIMETVIPNWNKMTPWEKNLSYVGAAIVLVMLIVWIVGCAMMGNVDRRAPFMILTACFMFVPALQIPAFIMACVGIHVVTRGTGTPGDNLRLLA